MAVEIIPINDHELYEVNGKEIWKDVTGTWICRMELSIKEQGAFNSYKKNIIDNPAFKKHPKANYKC